MSHIKTPVKKEKNCWTWK